MKKLVASPDLARQIRAGQLDAVAGELAVYQKLEGTERRSFIDRNQSVLVSALFAAAQGGRPALVKLLLPLVRENRHRTLMHAVDGLSSPTVKILVKEVSDKDLGEALERCVRIYGEASSAKEGVGQTKRSKNRADFLACIDALLAGAPRPVFPAFEQAATRFDMEALTKIVRSNAMGETERKKAYAFTVSSKGSSLVLDCLIDAYRPNQLPDSMLASMISNLNVLGIGALLPLCDQVRAIEMAAKKNTRRLTERMLEIVADGFTLPACHALQKHGHALPPSMLARIEAEYLAQRTQAPERSRPRVRL